ncbi:ABC-2 type transport system ATP-binding protein [Frondihabitans sp. PhB188]|uniref:ABC transporter ATP-binding protein n=1 Tax=Frondihabitans sp. PhB188 TaxID=2485200 RepID=UPI000F49F310|nr:ABC transporter ATP-binding protein [Frondihabitans sp. PhB188]ROQ38605.1 ABC-2 type transport system ATP-binding protein [Frondihabitans sp. PhB188]
MSEPMLVLSDVTRDFGRGPARRRAVDGVSLQIGPGEVLGVLGPNGAGKTTTIKMAATLLEPGSGGVQVAGVDAVRRPREARRSIGLVLGGDRGFYLRATATDNLRFFADLSGAASPRDSRVAAVLERVGLGDRGSSRVETFSRGMRQRLHVARALLADPPLILLDEPSIGLDPEGAQELRQLVRELRSEGRGILLTTHYLDEADQLADRLVVIVGGRAVVTGSSADIAAHAGISTVTGFMVESASDPADLVASDPDVATTFSARGLWSLDVLWGARGYREEIAADLRSRLVVVSEHTRGATLEESYLALLRGQSSPNAFS